MLLAGDVGGTKTHLGLFDTGRHRPVPVVTATFATPDFESLDRMVDRFLADAGGAPAPLDAALGVAGPVRGRTAELTNVRWSVDAAALESRFRFRRVTLLNDLQAMAFAVPVLAAGERVALQEGVPAPDGNLAIIAAGTGLGEAQIHRVGSCLVPSPSESGHADFAPRTEREIGLFRTLVQRFGRAEYEQVLSGPGLVNIHEFVHAGSSPCLAGVTGDMNESPAIITRAALAGTCPRCVETLDMFVSIYGAEAGNLVLHAMATSGLYIGGGIAPKILPALQGPAFLDAFRDKGAMASLMAGVPVYVILHPQVGLLGAAVAASFGADPCGPRD